MRTQLLGASCTKVYHERKTIPQRSATETGSFFGIRAMLLVDDEIATILRKIQGFRSTILPLCTLRICAPLRARSTWPAVGSFTPCGRLQRRGLPAHLLLDAGKRIPPAGPYGDERWCVCPIESCRRVIDIQQRSAVSCAALWSRSLRMGYHTMSRGRRVSDDAPITSYRTCPPEFCR